MTKTRSIPNSQRPVIKIKTKGKTKPVEQSKHKFDKGYEDGWKAGLVKGFHDGFDSAYASDN